MLSANLTNTGQELRRAAISITIINDARAKKKPRGNFTLFKDIFAKIMRRGVK